MFFTLILAPSSVSSLLYISTSSVSSLMYLNIKCQQPVSQHQVSAVLCISTSSVSSLMYLNIKCQQSYVSQHQVSAACYVSQHQVSAVLCISTSSVSSLMYLNIKCQQPVMCLKLYLVMAPDILLSVELVMHLSTISHLFGDYSSRLFIFILSLPGK